MNKQPHLLILWLFLMAGCVGEQEGTGERRLTREDLVRQDDGVPAFSSDSAYRFIEEQLAFGPRVPGTSGHKACAQYLTETLGRFTSHVATQRGRVTAYDDSPLDIYNIEARFYPEHKERILLCAHWDTRHVADQERDPEARNEPVMGASDGASGVAVILEIARHLADNDPGIGVDIVLFDAEDHGVPRFKQHKYNDNHTWALGSQYWARNLDRQRNLPQKGILLDMVGARNAVFFMEGHSLHFAPGFTRQVWQTARELGYSDLFRQGRAGAVMDDHYYVNTLAGIPTINIIDLDPRRTPHGFGDYWHTHRDDIDIISKETLGAVGHTVTTVLYE